MLPPQSQAKVKQLLQSGQKMAAIQFLCNEHKLSLLDAKIGFLIWQAKQRYFPARKRLQFHRL